MSESDSQKSEVGGLDYSFLKRTLRYDYFLMFTAFALFIDSVLMLRKGMSILDISLSNYQHVFTLGELILFFGIYTSISYAFINHVCYYIRWFVLETVLKLGLYDLMPLPNDGGRDFYKNSISFYELRTLALLNENSFLLNLYKEAEKMQNDEWEEVRLTRNCLCFYLISLYLHRAYLLNVFDQNDSTIIWCFIFVVGYLFFLIRESFFLGSKFRRRVYLGFDFKKEGFQHLKKHS